MSCNYCLNTFKKQPAVIQGGFGIAETPNFVTSEPNWEQFVDPQAKVFHLPNSWNQLKTPPRLNHFQIGQLLHELAQNCSEYIDFPLLGDLFSIFSSNSPEAITHYRILLQNSQLQNERIVFYRLLANLTDIETAKEITQEVIKDDFDDDHLDVLLLSVKEQIIPEMTPTELAEFVETIIQTNYHYQDRIQNLDLEPLLKKDVWSKLYFLSQQAVLYSILKTNSMDLVFINTLLEGKELTEKDIPMLGSLIITVWEQNKKNGFLEEIFGNYLSSLPDLNSLPDEAENKLGDWILLKYRQPNPSPTIAAGLERFEQHLLVNRPQKLKELQTAILAAPEAYSFRVLKKFVIDDPQLDDSVKQKIVGNIKNENPSVKRNLWNWTLTGLMQAKLGQPELARQSYEKICREFEGSRKELFDNELLWDTNNSPLLREAEAYYAEVFPHFPEILAVFKKDWLQTPVHQRPPFHVLLKLAAQTNDPDLFKMAQTANLAAYLDEDLIDKISSSPKAVNLLLERIEEEAMNSSGVVTGELMLAPSAPPEYHSYQKNLFSTPQLNERFVEAFLEVDKKELLESAAENFFVDNSSFYSQLTLAANKTSDFTDLLAAEEDFGLSEGYIKALAKIKSRLIKKKATLKREK